jgi:hypothetical protein
MPCNRQPSNSAAYRSVALLLCLVLTLAGCAAAQVGFQAGAKSKYQSIALIPRVNDNLLFVHRTNIAEMAVSQSRLGWDAVAGTGQISKEILGGAGASVVVTSDQNSAAARDADALIVLQQTPLDQYGQQYAPGLDVLLSSVSIAAAAAAGGMAYIIIDDPRRYSARSILEVNGNDGSGTNHCAVGITPTLMNAQTGELIKQGRSLMGVEKIPVQLAGGTWGRLTPAEKSNALAYCQSALRRVVSQSFVELDIVQ